MASKKHQRNGSAISVHFVQQHLDPHTVSNAPAVLPADPVAWLPVYLWAETWL